MDTDISGKTEGSFSGQVQGGSLPGDIAEIIELARQRAPVLKGKGYQRDSVVTDPLFPDNAHGYYSADLSLEEVLKGIDSVNSKLSDYLKEALQEKPEFRTDYELRQVTEFVPEPWHLIRNPLGFVTRWSRKHPVEHEVTVPVQVELEKTHSVGDLKSLILEAKHELIRYGNTIEVRIEDAMRQQQSMEVQIMNLAEERYQDMRDFNENVIYGREQGIHLPELVKTRFGTKPSDREYTHLLGAERSLVANLRQAKHNMLLCQQRAGFKGNALRLADLYSSCLTLALEAAQNTYDKIQLVVGNIDAFIDPLVNDAELMNLLARSVKNIYVISGHLSAATEYLMGVGVNSGVVDAYLQKTNTLSDQRLGEWQQRITEQTGRFEDSVRKALVWSAEFDKPQAPFEQAKLYQIEKKV